MLGLHAQSVKVIATMNYDILSFTSLCTCLCTCGYKIHTHMNLHIYAMHAGVIEKPFFSLEEKFL